MSHKFSSKHIRLWLHIVSEHANCISPEDTTYDDLKSYHNHEHKSPGTIRNHPKTSRDYSLQRVGKVLSEAEDVVVPTPEKESESTYAKEHSKSFSQGANFKLMSAETGECRELRENVDIDIYEDLLDEATRLNTRLERNGSAPRWYLDYGIKL